MRCTEMPDARAACGFSPTARRRKPRLERSTSHHTNTVAAITMMKPQSSSGKRGPSSSGNCAFAGVPCGDRLIAGGTLQDAGRAHHPRHEVERDVVEHDREDHLVRAGAGLQHTDDATPDRTARDACGERERQLEEHRQVEVERQERRGRARDQHLAAAADVEEAHAEGQRDAEAGGDERRGESERVRRAVGSAWRSRSRGG